MNDIRDCYDSFLSAAAATENSAYGTLIMLIYLWTKIFIFVVLFACITEAKINWHYDLIST